MSKKMLKGRTTVAKHDGQELSLSSIEWLPEMLQVRESLDMGWVNEYSNGYAQDDPFPPVLVFRLPKDVDHPAGRLVLADGFHRYAAVEKLELPNPTIRAQIRDGTMTDALLAALEANTAAFHRGRKFEEADGMNTAKLFIRNDGTRDWSDIEIARRCRLAAITVRKIRLVLKDCEGILLPTRVLMFADGVPTGRTIRYKKSNLAHRRIIAPPDNSSKGKLSYRAIVDGKQLSLGSDVNAADDRFHQIKAARTAMERKLVDTKSFSRWLLNQMINYQVVPSSCIQLRGIYVGNALLQPIANVDRAGFLAAVGRLLLVRQAFPAIKRMIVVGYVKGEDTCVGELLAHARRLGIEFMTPEELIAEFGPKDDGVIE